MCNLLNNRNVTNDTFYMLFGDLFSTIKELVRISDSPHFIIKLNVIFKLWHLKQIGKRSHVLLLLTRCGQLS